MMCCGELKSLSTHHSQLKILPFHPIESKPIPSPPHKLTLYSIPFHPIPSQASIKKRTSHISINKVNNSRFSFRPHDIETAHCLLESSDHFIRNLFLQGGQNNRVSYFQSYAVPVNTSIHNRTLSCFCVAVIGTHCIHLNISTL
jgi:hypothetical protein